MTKANAARVRRRLVRKGAEAELRRRGVNPDSAEAREWMRERTKQKEAAEIAAAITRGSPNGNR